VECGNLNKNNKAIPTNELVQSQPVVTDCVIAKRRSLTELARKPSRSFYSGPKAKRRKRKTPHITGNDTHRMQQRKLQRCTAGPNQHRSPGLGTIANSGNVNQPTDKMLETDIKVDLIINITLIVI